MLWAPGVLWDAEQWILLKRPGKVRMFTLWRGATWSPGGCSILHLSHTLILLICGNSFLPTLILLVCGNSFLSTPWSQSYPTTLLGCSSPFPDLLHTSRAAGALRAGWAALPLGHGSLWDEGQWCAELIKVWTAILEWLQSRLLLPLTFQAREVMSEQRWAEGQYQTFVFRQVQIKDNNALLRLEIAGRRKNSVTFPDCQRRCSLPAHPGHGFFWFSSSPDFKINL